MLFVLLLSRFRSFFIYGPAKTVSRTADCLVARVFALTTMERLFLDLQTRTTLL